MSNTYTPNVKFAMPAIGDNGWSIPVNGNVTTLDGMTAVGALYCSTNEVPSASLSVAIAAGTFVQQSGVVGTFAGTTQAMSASVTRVLFLDGTASWALTVAASYPSTPHVRIATVVTGSSTISSIADNRQCFEVVGSWQDGANITLGSVTGSQIGTSGSQKLGFYGTTPVVQQTLGAATAGTSYTTNEQGMLNRIYAAYRAIGLGN